MTKQICKLNGFPDPEILCGFAKTSRSEKNGNCHCSLLKDACEYQGDDTQTAGDDVQPAVDKEHKNPHQKWVANNTRKTAIEAFCMTCIGSEDPDSPPTGYKLDIKNCSSHDCPLYEWRPYRKRRVKGNIAA